MHSTCSGLYILGLSATVDPGGWSRTLVRMGHCIWGQLQLTQVNPWELEQDPDELRRQEEERRKAEEAAARAQRAEAKGRCVHGVRKEQMGQGKGVPTVTWRTCGHFAHALSQAVIN
eukprot:1147901-Pelagomonas_calceolata.AAC.6